jgi:adenylate cyclase, class 2
VAREIEIKLPLSGAAEGRRLLRAAGFRVTRRRVFESNTLFDISGYVPGCAGCVLRIREAGRRVLLTYKGPATMGKHKSREEMEVEFTDARTLAAIFERLNLRSVLRYEKYRTEYRRAGERGMATLDETPAGDFIELEGAPGWIDRTARRLGFREASYITESYYGLYAAYCRQHGIKLGHMTFRNARRRSSSCK